MSVSEANCRTRNGTPATMMLPVRVTPVWFAATEYCTLPSPVPEAPAAIAIHGESLAAFQDRPVMLECTTTDPAAGALPNWTTAGAKLTAPAIVESRAV